MAASVNPPSTSCRLIRRWSKFGKAGLDSRFDVSALGPDAMEDRRGNAEANQNANDAIADFIKISVRCVTSEHAEEKSERDLQAGITNPFASDSAAIRHRREERQSGCGA